MTRFILRRLALTIPVLLGILFLVFALARLVPGDPCRAALGERASDAACNAFSARNGLDQPIPVQFGIYLGQVVTGDLGRSLKISRPVGELLIDRLPTTIELTLLAMSFAIVIGIPLGARRVTRRGVGA
jgi:peptide/nickel transport system permease protein